MLGGLEPVEIRAREPVSSEITRRLVAYLTSGEIEPGELLPSERSLAESLGVGRSYVRQALKSLSILGLVDGRQGAGTYLRRTDSPLLPLALEWGLLLGVKRTTDLIDARRHLEVLLAGLAADRRTGDQLQEMRRLLAVMEQTAGTDEFVDADVAFHLEITAAAGNQSLVQIMRAIRTLVEVWVYRVAHSPGTAAPTWAEHAAVLRSIEDRDPAGAREAMDAHLSGALERLQETLTDPSPESAHSDRVASLRAMQRGVEGVADPVGRGGGLRDPIDLSGREGLSIEISRRLLNYVLSGGVQPGQRLPAERKLAEILGVGRSVLREALKSLALLGLLEVRVGDGTYVKRTDAEVLPQTIQWGLVIKTEHILDLGEARRHLEVIVAGLAAERRADEAVPGLRRMLELMPGEAPTAGLLATDERVLRRIAELAGNEVLTAALSTIRSLLQVWLTLVPTDQGTASASLKQVVISIASQDSEGARIAMAAYVDLVNEGLAGLLAADLTRARAARSAASGV